jgi:hypothetical protein
MCRFGGMTVRLGEAAIAAVLILMPGALVTAHTAVPTAAELAASTTSALATSQCQDLPASTSPTPSPSASPSVSPSASPSGSAAATSTAGSGELCVSVEAAQDSVRAGQTASWIIEVSVRGATATAVYITLVTIPSGPVPVFTASCPSGGGRTACTVGDMGTAVTPATYQFEAQATVPADTMAGRLTLVASADTDPIMTTIPSAGQAITITSAQATTKPKPSTAPTTGPTTAHTTAPTTAPTTATAPSAAATTAGTQSGAIPVATSPALGGLPTPAPVTTTISPGSVSGILPIISTSAAASTPAPAATILSSPAANIQAIGNPTATAGGDRFSIEIAMPAKTAQIIGWILVALVATLLASKLVADHTSRTTKPRHRAPRSAASGTADDNLRTQQSAAADETVTAQAPGSGASVPHELPRGDS